MTFYNNYALFEHLRNLYSIDGQEGIMWIFKEFIHFRYGQGGIMWIFNELIQHGWARGHYEDI